MPKIFELPLELETLIIAVLVSVSCSIIGSFIVSKKLSMVSDGISHAILLGIVLSFLIVKDLDSPFLLFGAIVSGVFLVVLTELLKYTKLVSQDTALGIVFPFFFSLGVLLISRYANRVHLDIDAVILGELAFAPFNRFEFLGYDWGSKSLVYLSFILLLNLVVLLLFFKELFLVCFDENFAQILKLKPKILSYLLILTLSITTVGAFEAAGSILVVALLVVPPTTAIMMTQSVKKIIALAISISILSSIAGFYLAIYFDLIISGMITSLLGIFFFTVLMFNSNNGFFNRLFQKRKIYNENNLAMLLVHLSQHLNTAQEVEECHKNKVAKNLFWDANYTKKLIKNGIQKKLLYNKNNILNLTDNGEKRAKEITEF